MDLGSTVRAPVLLVGTLGDIETGQPNPGSSTGNLVDHFRIQAYNVNRPGQ
jgi:hypothetical protein